MTDHRWTIGGGRALEPAPFLLMGVLNLSPESFSDAERGVNRPAHAAPLANDFAGLKAEARAMAQDGAAVLDVGMRKGGASDLSQLLMKNPKMPVKVNRSSSYDLDAEIQ